MEHFFFLVVPNFFLWLRLCPATGLELFRQRPSLSGLSNALGCSSTKDAVSRGLLPALE